MTKIDIFSGFLGAGKTTLIKKLLEEAYSGEKVVLIENEFGEIGIDGGFLAEAGIEITEMNSGCICCSLVGDFTEALSKVLAELHPDRILIEPSGVGKLSDVLRAVRAVESEDAKINAYVTVADVNKCRMYMKNFGEFYIDQIKEAGAIVLSHTDNAKPGRAEEAVELLREHNPNAVIVTTPWSVLNGAELLSAIEGADTLDKELEALEHEHHHHEDGEECHCHEHHHHEHHHHEDGEECHCHEHHHHEDGEECHCHEHHHHEDGEECHCHEHHHHEDGEECHCHEHHHHEDGEECHRHEHHHHEDGEECHCGCGGHHHGHHHADEVFTSVGVETVKKFKREELEAILESLSEREDCGMVLRAKGIVECECGKWLHFDYIPGEADVRCGKAGVIGRLCVIGAGIDKDKIKELFGV